MTHDIAQELMMTVDAAVTELGRLDDAVVAAKPSANTWSIKQIVGHLIDSASNNHQRFVGAQLTDGLVFPAYAQDEWVSAQDYQTRAWPDLLGLWQSYNHHLAHVISQIPADALDTDCHIGPSDSVTLRFLVDDYLVHLRHHLRQISERAGISTTMLTQRGALPTPGDEATGA